MGDTDADTLGLLGTDLLPPLMEQCEGRLHDVTWFRTDWQRGGALTGTGTFVVDLAPRPAMVKLPVPPRERRWLELLSTEVSGTDGEQEPVTPQLYAHGDELGGYDMCWVVMERLPHGPMSQAWGGDALAQLAQAAGRFYDAAKQHNVAAAPRHRDWDHIIDVGRQRVRKGGVPQAQRWNEALKKAGKKIDTWAARWERRPAETWCHGDLHLGNAMSRHPRPEGPAVLVDFAEVHRGHWVEDAVYLEHLYWGAPGTLNGMDICKAIATERESRGLPTNDDWSRYAKLFRGLLALSTPANLHNAGQPSHVEAALSILEAAVK